MNGDVSLKDLLWYFALAIWNFGYIHWTFYFIKFLSCNHTHDLRMGETNNSEMIDIRFMA